MLNNRGVVDVMKMGNIAPREGSEPTSLALRSSVLTIASHRVPDVTTIPTLKPSVGKPAQIYTGTVTSWYPS